jgi:D-glycero-alpha-D-manno-heptose-7-phosphate kinase
MLLCGPASNILVVYQGDVPARSGLGTSSTFVVALLAALHGFRGRHVFPAELMRTAILIERDKLGEVGGHQDQAWAAYGGPNIIRFTRDGDVIPTPLAMTPEKKQELESCLHLFCTGLVRNSCDVAQSYVAKVESDAASHYAMVRLAEDALSAISLGDWPKLGEAVERSWRLKASLSPEVAPKKVCELQVAARMAGAWGAKFTGAGGGGSLLCVAPPEKFERIATAMRANGCVHVPFRFERGGARIVFSGDDHAT